MQQLKPQIHSFPTSVFGSLQDLGIKQQRGPDAILVACSETGFAPDQISIAHAGDWIKVQNCGNQTVGLSPMAEIEYGIEMMDISRIVICGHSECSIVENNISDDCKHSQYHHASFQMLRDTVKTHYSHLQGEALLEAAVQENVLIQVERLAAVPFLASRLQSGALSFHAWIWVSATGRLFTFNATSKQFELS